MRRLFLAWTVLLSTLVLASALAAQDFKLDTQRVKERQKAEMKALKVKHKYAKQMMKNQELPKSKRKQMANKMKREERALRQKHKDEIESLKDRQRVLKEMNGG